ncbi:hypothetical protein BH09BAC5_BH09BAC5_15740 [soil metagenome]
MSTSDKNKDENIPDPFFHESDEYVSAFFGPVPDKILESLPDKSDDKTKSELIGQLTNFELRETRPDVLSLLRENDSRDLLIEIIRDKKYKKHRAAIIAACWETGMNFSAHLPLFINLLEDKHTDDFAAIEIATVIDEMQGPFDEKILEEAIRMLETFSVNEPLKREMLNGISLRLISFKKLK